MLFPKKDRRARHVHRAMLTSSLDTFQGGRGGEGRGGEGRGGEGRGGGEGRDSWCLL